MRSKRLIKGIFSRYSLAFVSIILVAFLLLIGITDLVLGRYFIDRQKDELTQLTATGSEMIRIDYFFIKESDKEWTLDNENRYWLWERLITLYENSDTFLIVTDQTGTIVHAPESELLGVSIDASINETLLEVGHADGVSTCGIFSDAHYYCAESIIYDTQHVATVYSFIPSSLVKTPLTAIMRMIAVICFWVMLATIVAAYVISEKIKHPLAEMSKAAKAFADGDFSVRVPVKGGDEISAFAKVFNEMADNLENIDKTRNDFIANVSHDLRSPMTSITGFLDGMINGVIPPEKHDHYLRIVLNETKRLSRLVATLLDISKIQAGERKFRLRDFDICEMARQIIISLENRIEEKNLDVSFESDADRIFVHADMDSIYQVLYNLCDNASKFAYDGKKFTVSVLDKGGYVLVSVFNEGAGIAKEDLKYVFDRFYKADKSRGMDKSGMGLGLYISKKIIEAHRQRIDVKSVYGESCTFCFTLEKGDRPTRGRGLEPAVSK